MTLVKNIFEFIDRFAPFCTAMDFDNAGLLVGSGENEVKKIGVVLDITPDAVEYAAQQNIDLIISHHPVIFSPLKKLKSDGVPYLLAKNNMSAICAHTNLDCARGGVNDVLAHRLELYDITSFSDGEFPHLPPIGRVGTLPRPMDCREFAAYVKEKLHTDGVEYVEGKNIINRVAVCGGSGGSMLCDVLKTDADAYVTGEAKHHELLYAKNEDFTLVVAGHFETENPVEAELAKFISLEFPNVEVFVIPQNSPVKRI